MAHCGQSKAPLLFRINHKYFKNKKNCDIFFLVMY